ncbi:MAG: M20 family metallopeptidase [Fidelibacterota bacterium]
MISPIEMRHKIHQFPELALQEFETTKLLTKAIRQAADINDCDIIIHQPLKTGLLIEYKQNSGSYTMLRADIDALPVIEQTGWKYASKNQNMHACGHDVHTAILYGFLLEVMADKPQQNFLFLFQPAEETVGGAEMLLATGILDKFDINQVFALHVNDDFEKGTIATNDSVLFASSYELNIEFQGNSAHVAFPQNGRNALHALRTFMDQVEKIPQDYIHPIIYGIGRVEAGKIRNIIPDFAKLEGTIRSFQLTRTKEYIAKLELILQGIESATGVEYQLKHGINHNEVVNTPELYKLAKDRLYGEFNFLKCEIKMAGEDFGHFADKYPSLMMWQGTRTGDFYGLHHPKFLPDDSIIQDGINVYKRLTED